VNIDDVVVQLKDAADLLAANRALKERSVDKGRVCFDFANLLIFFNPLYQVHI
jgi:hypothetical protein